MDFPSNAGQLAISILSNHASILSRSRDPATISEMTSGSMKSISERTRRKLMRGILKRLLVKALKKRILVGRCTSFSHGYGVWASPVALKGKKKVRLGSL